MDLGADFGQSLDSETIKKGLRELCSDLHFDMGTNLNHWHPMQDTRQGVFHNGRHICSMDRGMCPEFKVWDVQTRVVPVPLNQADQEGVRVFYSVITLDTPGYEELHLAAQKGKYEDLQVRPDGTLIRLAAHKEQKARGRVIRVGWRHTFERLILGQVPGITREALAAKFNVDMWKFPVGGPDETFAQVMEE
jgi:hypothetical protein